MGKFIYDLLYTLKNKPLQHIIGLVFLCNGIAVALRPEAPIQNRINNFIFCIFIGICLLSPVLFLLFKKTPPGEKVQQEIDGLNREIDGLNREIDVLVHKRYRLATEESLLNEEIQNQSNMLRDLENEKQKLTEDLNKQKRDLLYQLEAKRRDILYDFKKQSRLELQREENHLFQQIDQLKAKLESYQDNLDAVEIGINTIQFEFERSETYKQQLRELRLKEQRMIKDGSAFENPSKETKKLEVLMIRAFNNESNNIIEKTTYVNAKSKKDAIIRAYDSINNLGKSIDKNDLAIAKISLYYMELKLKELEIAYKYLAKKEIEKEILQEEREKEKQEQLAQIEIRTKREKIEKEVAALRFTKDRLTDKLISATSDEIKSLSDEINVLKEKIEILQSEREDLDYRLEHLGAGYVYIISNIGSFGENVFKIGVTRRLDPYERISELSSASVPFKFDVHAMIFSYNAYELEKELHQHFSKFRINKVNNRKEFFHIALSEIKKKLDEHKDLVFDFSEDAKALEYRETKRLEFQ